MHELVDKVNVAKNSMSRKHVFAPDQHVFGCDLKVPGLISKATEQIPFNTGVVHASDWFQRSHEMKADDTYSRTL